MRLIKLAGTTLPALISVLLVHGQEIPLPKPLPKVDSVRSSLERQAKEKAAGIRQQLMPVDTGLVKRTLQANKQELGKLWDETQQPLQDVLSKVKIFGSSKLLRSTGTEIKADYSHLNDSTGVALGAFQDLRSIYNYTVNSGVALFDMPFGF